MKSPCDPTGLLREVDSILEEPWGETFTYDRLEAEKSGVVMLLYKRTNREVRVAMTISAKSFENREFGHRELRRKIKDCLPDQLINIRISEVNRILRDAPRRNLKAVEKDFITWCEAAVLDLDRCFGPEACEQFEQRIALPASVVPGSIQAIQYLVEQKVQILQELT